MTATHGSGVPLCDLQAQYRELRPQLEANQTRVLRGPHMTALIEDWWQARRQKAQPAPAEEPPRRAA